MGASDEEGKGQGHIVVRLVMMERPRICCHVVHHHHDITRWVTTREKASMSMLSRQMLSTPTHGDVTVTVIVRRVNRSVQGERGKKRSMKDAM